MYKQIKFIYEGISPINFKIIYFIIYEWLNSYFSKSNCNNAALPYFL